ncbi:MAG: trypsin-like peptidase domain-containing protein [Cyanobacteria bacterium SZAS TMP-1]|nr:trypsin-like peptidase domain-containing protein [Cyanobacteria bacterium SZAS TMP-1]
MPEYHVVMSSDLKRNIAFKNKFDAPALFSTVRDSKFTVYVDVLEKGKTKKYQGSGFFVYKESGKEGFCEGTTAYHVVGDAQKVHVVLNNGKSYDASVVAGDSLKDLAVLRVKGMQPGSCRVLPLAEGMSLRPSAPLLELTARDFEMRYRTGTAAGYVMHPVLAKGSWLELKMDGTTYDGDSGSAIISKRGAVVGIHHSTAVLSHVGYSTPAFYLRQMLSKLHPGKI